MLSHCLTWRITASEFYRRLVLNSKIKVHPRCTLDLARSHIEQLGSGSPLLARPIHLQLQELIYKFSCWLQAFFATSFRSNNYHSLCSLQGFYHVSYSFSKRSAPTSHTVNIPPSFPTLTHAELTAHNCQPHKSWNPTIKYTNRILLCAIPPPLGFTEDDLSFIPASSWSSLSPSTHVKCLLWETICKHAVKTASTKIIIYLLLANWSYKGVKRLAHVCQIS